MDERVCVTIPRGRMLDTCIGCLTAFLVVCLATIVYICASYGFGRDEVTYFIADECAYSVNGKGKAALAAENVNSLGVEYNGKRYLFDTLMDGDSIIVSYGMDFSDKQEFLRIESDLLLEYGDGRSDPEYRINKLLGIYDEALYFTLQHYYLRPFGEGNQITDCDSVTICRVPLSGGEYEAVQQYDVGVGGLPEFTEIYNGTIYLFSDREANCAIQKFNLDTHQTELITRCGAPPMLYWFSENMLYFAKHPRQNLYYLSLSGFSVIRSDSIVAPVAVTEKWIYWYSGDFDAFDGTLTLCRTSMDFSITEELVNVPYGGQHVTGPKLISDNAIVYTDPKTGKLFYMNPEKNDKPVPLGIEPSGAGYGTGYIIQSVNEISPNYDPAELHSTICTFAPPAESIEELREQITVIVRARLTDSVDLSSGYLDTLYTFEFLEDFLNTSESEIHLTAEKTSFLEVGGVYYLFMDCLDLPNYPYRVYSLIDPQLIVREYLLNGELVYDFKAKDFCPKTVQEGDIRRTIKRLMDT